MNLSQPSRAQVEIALLVAGTLALLWLYRSYLERSLELQRGYMDDLLAEREREHQAVNGNAPGAVVEAVAAWFEQHRGGVAPAGPAQWQPPAQQPPARIQTPGGEFPNPAVPPVDPEALA